MQVQLTHIDTCLPCYLTDHHNRDGECLLGAYVDGTTTNADVHTALLDEFRATADRVPEEAVSSAAFVAALDELFANIEAEALFDASLEVLDEEEAETIGGDEMCQAWFLLTWTAEETA